MSPFCDVRSGTKVAGKRPPNKKHTDANMSNTQARRYVLLAAAIGMLAAPLTMKVQKVSHEAPIVAAAPAQTPPTTIIPAAMHAAPQPQRVAEVGERSPYIVQA